MGRPLNTELDCLAPKARPLRDLRPRPLRCGSSFGCSIGTVQAAPPQLVFVFRASPSPPLTPSGRKARRVPPLRA
ncbi:MAG: hypothetical protein BLITH_0510 [Brockia lithotrophica]|uniref:Uncharacterized protein n=1 Tax=Brockia lithotrophica TaxID=933949 RepID=A0A2T5G4F0_9BACL|nr:MAG: hypothetical protein BLITH_0510 [Brockia lithotrophica]